jgi:hypothetical protein
MLANSLARRRRAAASRRLFAAVDRRRRELEDPLCHPILRAMSARELSDIPFASAAALQARNPH